MEGFTVFVDWKSQHNKDVNYPQIDIQVPHNSYQNSRKTFGDIDKIILKSIWQGKDTRIGKHDLRIYITTVSKTVVLVGG